jgi:Family of unknown function (DUF6252)
MKNIFIAAASLLLLLSACKKEVTELPAATQTGANTFGAKVNGEFWVPQGFGPIPANDILEGRLMPNKDIYINARNFSSSPNEREFEIYLKGVTAPGTYMLNQTVPYPTTAANYGYFVKRNLTPQNEWITSATNTGAVTITRIDTVALIVSGTFQFTALNLYNNPEPLSVTEGRFDIKMH